MAQPLQHSDLGQGLDGLRPEHKLGDGYWLESTNCDPSLSGSLKKRDGYSLFAGLVPLRVKSIARSTTTMTLTLPNWIDASALRPRTVLLYGRTSSAMGGLTTTNQALLKVATPGSGSTITVPCVDSGAPSDNAPQLVVYGLDITRFSAKSSTAGSRAGWVHHLDTYHEGATGRKWPVCAVGGNFFAGHDNASLATGLNELVLPRIRFTHGSQRILGPAFWATGASPGLTRGFLTHDAGEEGTLPISAVQWISGGSGNRARFTFSGTVTLSGTLSTVLKAGGDRLSVTQAPHSLFNGDFLIVGSALNSGTLTIDCEVPGLEDDRFDASNIGAFGGVWTDAMETDGSPALPVGARVNAADASRVTFANTDISGGELAITSVWADNQELVFTKVSGATPGGLTDGATYWAKPNGSNLQLRASLDGPAITITSAGAGSFYLSVPDGQEVWTVVGTSGTSVFVDGQVRRALVQAGRVVKAAYTGKVTQLRDSGGSTADAGSLIEGDVLDVDSQPDAVRPKVKNRAPSANLSVSSIVGDGTSATATVGSTAELAVGDILLLVGSQHFSGEVTVESIPSSTTFTFASTSEETEGSGSYILGSCIAVDLQTDWEDAVTDAASTQIDIFRRWQPIEFVESVNTALVDFNTVQHFDVFDDEKQPFVKSVMMNDSLYLTNGYDEVFKYDGVNLIRAGLPPQQLVMLGGEVNGLGNAPFEVYHVDSNDRDYEAIVTDNKTNITQVNGTVHTTLSANDAGNFNVGDRVAYTIASTNFNPVVSAEVVSTDGGTKINVKEFIRNTNPTGPGWGYDFRREYTLAYYIRMHSVDRNSRATGSAITQIDDLVYNFFKWTTGQVKMMRPIPWPGIDHSRLELQAYRRPITSTTVSFDSSLGLINYDLARPVLTDWVSSSYYYTLKDTAKVLPRSADQFNYAVKGAKIAQHITFPPRAQTISAAAGRLLLGSVKSYPTASIKILPIRPLDDSLLTTSNLHTCRFKVEGNGRNFTYELINPAFGSNYSSNCKLEVIDGTSFRVIGPTNTYQTMQAGDWVYIANSTNESAHLTNKCSLDFIGWYQIQSTDANTTATFAYNCRAPLTISGVDTGAGTIEFSSHHSIPPDTAQLMSFYGTLPGGVIEKYSYKAVYVSPTKVRLYDRLPVPNAITLSSSTSGGKAQFVDIYDTNSSYPAAADTAVSVYFSTNRRWVPVPLMNFPSGAMTGRKTRALRLNTNNQSMVYHLVQWLASAINATQVASINTTSFRPFVHARAGEDFSSGELVLESPIALTSSPRVTFYQTMSPLEEPAVVAPYMNKQLMTSGVAYDFSVTAFPSRLCRSALNYPEVFDDPYNPSADSSDSAIDVDPASGGEITAIIPMFGDSAFGAAQYASSVLVAKSNGWYVVDVESKAVQKLDTNGIGCDFPRTVAATKNGVMFAHRSGLYKINRSLDIVPLGQILGRKWEAIDVSDTSDMTVASATHDARRSVYIASLPTADNEETDPPVHYGFAYDHTREVNPAGLAASGGTAGVGSWTEYDNLPSLGWANMGIDSLFATADGRIYARNRSNTNLDFRDDEAAVESTAVYKLLNFGITGIRKLLRGLVTTFRASTSQLSTRAYWADSARLNFQPFDDFRIEAGAARDGVTDLSEANIHSIKLSAPARKGDLMTLKVENDGLYEGLELTDLTFFVDPLSDQGVREAGDEDA